jgi:hypothetical protein
MRVLFLPRPSRVLDGHLRNAEAPAFAGVTRPGGLIRGYSAAQRGTALAWRRICSS